MPSKCCVDQCNNNILRAHYFPKDKELRTLWIKAIGKQNWEPGKAKICYRHFKDSDYITEYEFGN